jgi:SRSO17 transposase
LDYLRAQLTLDRRRNFAQIDRRLNGGDGQGLHHFMSNSPWRSELVWQQIQAEVSAEPDLVKGSILILDECADEKAGLASVGADQQYNGRLGTVGVCQVATCLAYAHPQLGVWTLVDGELLIPPEWFSEAWAARRQQAGVPAERRFATKVQLGLKMIRRAKAHGLPFELLACDEVYGRNYQFRAELDSLQIQYAARVPANTLVYMQEPHVGIPDPWPKRGQVPKRPYVLSAHDPVTVRAIACQAGLGWQHVSVRDAERGRVVSDFAILRVWTVARGKLPRQEWLVIRHDDRKTCDYTLMNAPADTPPQRLIEWSCQRYWVERTFEDAKSELGWDEFQAQRYPAWEHHMVLTALALWFVASTKLEWARKYPRDLSLTQALAVATLPGLSTANVRALLKAVLPLPQFTPSEAARLVAGILLRRTRSTGSRLKSQSHHGHGPAP